MIGLLKSKNKIVGVKQTKKAVEQEKLIAVFIANDADQRIILPVKQLCETKNIPIHTVETMKQLGKSAGIEVGASIVGIF